MPVHPHVQRSFVHEAEAALLAIQLVRGNPEVQHEAVDGSDPQFREGRRNAGEVSLENLCPAAEPGKPRPGHCYRLGVPVEADQYAVGSTGGQDQTRVPRAPKGAVDVDPARTGRKRAQHLFGHDRYVVKIIHL